jgi:hypothetical protein
MPKPSDGHLIDRRIDRLEERIENLAKSVEAINRAIADAKAANATRERRYIRASR